MSDPITYKVSLNGTTHIVQADGKAEVRKWVDEQTGLSIKPASAADVVEFAKQKGDVVTILPVAAAAK
jgi:hypothetical protein